MRAPITTHILDTQRGIPAVGVKVVLSSKRGEQWSEIATAQTNADGRVEQWSGEFSLAEGEYRLSFATLDYFNQQNLNCFYPQIDITFLIDDLQRHYHVPLLLSAFAYSTYRGS